MNLFKLMNKSGITVVCMSNCTTFFLQVAYKAPCALIDVTTCHLSLSRVRPNGSSPLERDAATNCRVALRTAQKSDKCRLSREPTTSSCGVTPWSQTYKWEWAIPAYRRKCWAMPRDARASFDAPTSDPSNLKWAQKHHWLGVTFRSI